MQQSWTSQQCKTFQHWLALIGFALVVMCSFRASDSFEIYLSYGAFFLVTAWPMLKNMILISIVVGVLVAAFPFLAPFAFLLMAFFFLKRIQFVFTHWRPVLGGLVIYGSAFVFLDHSMRYGLYRLLPNLNWQHIDMTLFGRVNHYSITLFVGLAGAVFIQLLLILLYRRGYNSKSALGIMGGVPLVLAAFLLPFLKLHTGFDTMFDGADPMHGDSMHGEPMPEGYAAKAPPGYHTVKSYVRTAPDGIESNNLSSHHPDGTDPQPELQVVRGHVRSNPDGIVENNLSFRGETVHMETIPTRTQPETGSPVEVYDYSMSGGRNKEQSAEQPSASGFSGKKKLLAGLCGILIVGFAAGKYFETEQQQPIKQSQPAISNTIAPNPSGGKAASVPATTAQTAKADPLSSKDIVLAKVRPGSSFAETKRLLGSPLKQEKGNDGIIYTFPNGVEVTVNAKADTVRGVTIDTASAVTSRGIRVGASASQVLSAYGNAAVTAYDKYHLYEYQHTGSPASILRFAVDKTTDKVEYIGVRLNQ